MSSANDYAGTGYTNLQMILYTKIVGNFTMLLHDSIPSLGPL